MKDLFDRLRVWRQDLIPIKRAKERCQVCNRRMWEIFGVVEEQTWGLEEQVARDSVWLICPNNKDHDAFLNKHEHRFNELDHVDDPIFDQGPNRMFL